MKLTDVGAAIAIAAFAGLGLVELIHGSALPGLHPLDDSTPTWVVRGSGALLAAGAIAMLFGPTAGLMVAALWLAAFALALAAASGASDVLAWPPAAETIVFSAFAIWRWDDARGWLILRLLLGAMLVLFGAIHLTQRDLIATLIPDWIPVRSYWPWLTGGVSVAAGLACLAGRGTTLGAGAIAFMYLAWLPLVHAPRLLGAPGSLFEWTFALTALALAGVAFAVAARAARK
jgi:uncharacterized membrane protein